ncbi:MAG TPA: hypothetical protein VD948_13015 [Rhodothermales bacterium]|nr:hypothetical protein [Rhodothermales bacterium]
MTPSVIKGLELRESQQTVTMDEMLLARDAGWSLQDFIDVVAREWPISKCFEWESRVGRMRYYVTSVEEREKVAEKAKKEKAAK